MTDVTADDNPVTSLVNDLRKLRSSAGNPPFRKMAADVKVSYAVLARAVSGKAGLPTWTTVKAFVEACERNPADWRPRWEIARDADRLEPTPEPGPLEADTVAGLTERLRRLKLARRNLSYRRIAGDSGLPTSTVADAFNPARPHPPSWDVLRRILSALGVSQKEQQEWKEALRNAALESGGQRPDRAGGMTRLQRQAGSLGLEGIYPTRADALKVFADAIDRELELGKDGRIWICGSSLKGIIQVAVGPFDGSELIQRIMDAKCDLRLLCTHPAYAEKRAEQENRMEHEIEREIMLSLSHFRRIGVDPEKVKYHKNMPNVFAVTTSERMLINPYPHGGEAFRDFTLIVHRTPNPDSIFDRYMRKHFEAAWKNADRIPDEHWHQS